MRVERPPGLDRRTGNRKFYGSQTGRSIPASTGPGSQCVSRKLASVLVRLAVSRESEGRKASGKPMLARDP
ncbi:hypothetical protein QQF64_033673 [Cirrhinus molitorella]|uniref:Uncharacterized protein n=1 Tax=Cirrhinus molitorella TaxID=172907 RepID=A0ABR3MUJ4_9TELE